MNNKIIDQLIITVDELVNRIASGTKETIPKRCPSKYSKLIKWCWNNNPKNRPSIEKVIKHLERYEKQISKYQIK